MARVTVEDCILKIPNRFDLVLLAAKRARQLSGGAPLTVDRDNDKNAVVSLREIADETINLNDLETLVVKGYQTTIEPDLYEEDLEELSFDDTTPAEALAVFEADDMKGQMFEDADDALDEEPASE